MTGIEEKRVELEKKLQEFIDMKATYQALMRAKLKDDDGSDAFFEAAEALAIPNEHLLQQKVEELQQFIEEFEELTGFEAFQENKVFALKLPITASKVLSFHRYDVVIGAIKEEKEERG